MELHSNLTGTILYNLISDEYNLTQKGGVLGISLLKNFLLESFYRFRENRVYRTPVLHELWKKIEHSNNSINKDSKITIQYTLDEFFQKDEPGLQDHSKKAYRERNREHFELSKIEHYSWYIEPSKIPDILFGYLHFLEQHKVLKVTKLIYRENIFMIHLRIMRADIRDILLEDNESRIHKFSYSTEGVRINERLWTMNEDKLPDKFFRLVCRYFSLHKGTRKVELEELKKYNLPDSGISNEQLTEGNIRRYYIPKINETFRKKYNNRYLRNMKILQIHSSLIEAKRPNIGGSETMIDLFTS